MKNFLIAAGLVIASCFCLLYGCSITISTHTSSYNLHAVYIFITLAAIFFVWEKIANIQKQFASDPVEKMADTLQKAISAMFVKDAQSLQTHISQMRKFTPQHPMLFWLEGHMALLQHKNVDAKASLYKTLTEEKNSALGAYSLYMLYKQNNDYPAALETLDRIMETYPTSSEITRQAIIMHVQRCNITSVLKYTEIAKKNKQLSDKELAAIYCFIATNIADPQFLQKAYQLDVTLAANTIQYAKHLSSTGLTKKAQKALIRAFASHPDREIFKAYINLLSHDDQILKKAHRILSANDCWEGHYEYGILALEKQAYMIAYQHLLKAYQSQQYSFIYDALLEAWENTEQQESGQSWLNSSPTIVEFAWQCKNCRNTSHKWIPVCSSCNQMATFYRTALAIYDDIMDTPSYLEGMNTTAKTSEALSYQENR